MAGGTLTPGITVAPSLAHLKLGTGANPCPRVAGSRGVRRCVRTAEDRRQSVPHLVRPARDPGWALEQGWLTVVLWSGPRGPEQWGASLPNPTL